MFARQLCVSLSTHELEMVLMFAQELCVLFSIQKITHEQEMAPMFAQQLRVSLSTHD
jgi:hypothetical protein